MANSELVRPYRGVTPEDRVARRRDALMNAALEVFAADGMAGLSARRVCEQAGLTRRYFYESFADTDALAGALFQRVASEVEDAVRGAVTDADVSREERVRLGIGAGLDVLTAAPQKGQFLMAAQESGSVGSHRIEAVDRLASVVEASLPRDIAPGRARVAAISVVGATLAVIDNWLRGDISLSRDEVVQWCASAAIGLTTELVKQ